MAKRPVFVPSEAAPFVREVEVDFRWHAGLSRAQAQRSIVELHASAGERGLAPLLEISSKSAEGLGVHLSAFNLTFEGPDGRRLSVEAAYQGSKVFASDGPFHDLYGAPSRDAKLDGRVKGRSDIVAFDFFGERWPTAPTTAFYDWLYLYALRHNPALADALGGYAGFTDIAFNPEKSVACQARCAAMHVALVRQSRADARLDDRDAFLALLGAKATEPVQAALL